MWLDVLDSVGCLGLVTTKAQIQLFKAGLRWSSVSVEFNFRSESFKRKLSILAILFVFNFIDWML